MKLTKEDGDYQINMQQVIWVLVPKDNRNPGSVAFTGGNLLTLTAEQAAILSREIELKNEKEKTR